MRFGWYCLQNLAGRSTHRIASSIFKRIVNNDPTKASLMKSMPHQVGRCCVIARVIHVLTYVRMYPHVHNGIASIKSFDYMTALKHTYIWQATHLYTVP